MRSFFGPHMELSTTASRFDSSVSWLAAIGNVASLEVFDRFGVEAIHARNRHLETLLRQELTEAGWDPTPLPVDNRSTIVSVPLVDLEPSLVVTALAEQHVIASVRDNALR